MISQKEVNSFQQHGAICLRGIFKQKWLDQLAVGIEKIGKIPVHMLASTHQKIRTAIFMMITAIGTGLKNIKIFYFFPLLLRLLGG